jgi:hypothetical protein
MSLLADERTERLLRALASGMPTERLKEGHAMYRGGRVLVMEVVMNTLYGAVNDGGVYAVTLDADDMAYSTCTCPAEEACAHMAALFFRYCESAGGDADAVLRLLAEGGPDVRGEADAMSGGSDGPEAWAEWFAGRFGDVWRQCRHSLHPLQPVLQEAKGKARDWPLDLRRLHWLQAVLLVLEQAELAYAETDPSNRYYYELSFSRSTEPWVQHWLELLGETAPVPGNGTEERWLRAIAVRLRNAMLDTTYRLLRWDELYVAWWDHFAGWRDAVLEERDAIGRLAGETAGGDASFADSPRAIAILTALAFFRFRAGDHGGAIDAMGRTPLSRTASFVCRFAERCLSDGDFGALERWMLFLHGALKTSRNSTVLKAFLKLCRAADERQPEHPLWVRMMREWLPLSYGELSAHYLARGRLREWTDLQLATGVRPEDLDPAHLRSLAKEAPELLLPLFHRAVEEAVRTRGRQGYRAAVRHLKRLEKLYRASGRQERWRRFIREFRVRHARLRALQEELRYANLAED